MRSTAIAVNVLMFTLSASSVAIAFFVMHGQSRAFREDERKISVGIVPEWEEYLTGGHAVGPSDAPVVIVEFFDFQCPYCKRLAANLHSILEKYPNKIRLVLRHYPLASIHPYAMTAAEGSECAAAQGRFDSFTTLALELQDSLGVMPWTRLASLAGVPDDRGFMKCLRKHEFRKRIQEDIEAGDRLGVYGTPTVLFNGLRLLGTPDLTILNDLADSSLRSMTHE